MRGWSVVAGVFLLYTFVVLFAVVLLGPLPELSYSSSSGNVLPGGVSGGSAQSLGGRSSGFLGTPGGLPIEEFDSPEPAGLLISAVVKESGEMEFGQASSVLLEDGTLVRISQSVPVVAWKKFEGRDDGYWVTYPVRMREGQKVFVLAERTPKGELHAKEVRMREEE